MTAATNRRELGVRLSLLAHTVGQHRCVFSQLLNEELSAHFVITLLILCDSVFDLVFINWSSKVKAEDFVIKVGAPQIGHLL